MVESFTNYCDTSGSSPSVLMSVPDASNDVQTVPIGQTPTEPFYVIMQEHWRMPTAKEYDAPCFALQHFTETCPGWGAEDKCRDLATPPPGLPAATGVRLPNRLCVSHEEAWHDGQYSDCSLASSLTTLHQPVSRLHSLNPDSTSLNPDSTSRIQTPPI